MKTARNRDDMLFIDGRREEYWRRVRMQLEAWSAKGYEVVDIACGFGKYAQIFPPHRYVGLDFSDEMIAIAAKENPEHKFAMVDVREDPPTKIRTDIIFEVNSLKSLGMTADDFIKRYAPYAKVAVATLEADEFKISQLYPQ